ncbi:FmdB family transcriptional regulator [Candidatus Magnetomorum sp. HK-1]|nr:FmdB family transcriptional regulator [Candidatus Magnetomorum sp. HK-1]
MPLYEFKCNKCDEFFEILVMNSKDEVEMKCPKCTSEQFERVLSTSSYAMGQGSSPSSVNTQTRTCSSGNCTTYTLPGHTRD